MSPSPSSGSVEVSADRARLDGDLIHTFLSRESYWSVGIARKVIDRAIEGSVPFGAYAGGGQVGFARAVTDGATFAWIADVFVVATHRGQGIGTRLVEAVLAHPQVSEARNVLLATADAHGVYAPLGFVPLVKPERYLNLRRPSIAEWKNLYWHSRRAGSPSRPPNGAPPGA